MFLRSFIYPVLQLMNEDQKAGVHVHSAHSVSYPPAGLKCVKDCVHRDSVTDVTVSGRR